MFGWCALGDADFRDVCPDGLLAAHNNRGRGSGRSATQAPASRTSLGRALRNVGRDPHHPGSTGSSRSLCLGQLRYAARCRARPRDTGLSLMRPPCSEPSRPAGFLGHRVEDAALRLRDGPSAPFVSVPRWRRKAARTRRAGPLPSAAASSASCRRWCPCRCSYSHRRSRPRARRLRAQAPAMRAASPC